MKKTKLIFLLSLVSFLSPAQDGWQEFKKNNYSISYPPDWNYSDEKPQPTIEFILKASFESTKDDQFQENINLNLESLLEETNVSDYMKSTIDQIKTQVPSAKIIKNTSTEVNGLEAKEFIWSAKFGNDFLLKFKQIIFIKSKIAYVLTLTSTEKEFDRYITIGDKILYSFKFKD